MQTQQKNNQEEKYPIDDSAKSKNNKRHLYVIFFTVLLDMIGIGILIPIVPYLFDASSPYSIISAHSFINSSNAYFWQGVALAVFPFFQFLFAPILGELSDHYGRKKILIFCLIGTLIGNILTAFAILDHNFELFIIGRIIDGITAGNIAIAMASIADVSEPKDKAKNFGLIGSAFGIGFVIGPALGGILSKHFGADMPFWFSSALGLVNIILAAYLIRETMHRLDGKFNIHPSQAIKNVISGFKMPELRNIFTINILWVSAFAFYTAFAGVYLKQRFGLGLDQVGYYFALIGICIGITQAFIVKRVFGKYSDVHILQSSIALFSVVILVFIFSNSLIINILLVPLFTICIGLSNTAISAITSKRAGPQMQGRIIGIGASLQAISQAVPQLLAGVFATTLGYVAPLYATLTLAVVAVYATTKGNK